MLNSTLNNSYPTFDDPLFAKIKSFLEDIGYIQRSSRTFSNSTSQISILCESTYEVAMYDLDDEDNPWLCLYSTDFNIYWLIGVLTYNKLIDPSMNLLIFNLDK